MHGMRLDQRYDRKRIQACKGLNRTNVVLTLGQEIEKIKRRGDKLNYYYSS